MHIAFVSPGWPIEKSQNGIVTCVHWMKHGLESKGHTISVFSGGAQSTDAAARVYAIPPLQKLPRLLRVFRRSRPSSDDLFNQSQVIATAILAVHRTNPIDVIEMEESFGWFSGVGQITKIPVAVKLHGPAFLSLVAEEQKSAFAREKIEREGAALYVADAIVSPSQITLSQTIARYGLSPRLCKHIVNPITLDPDTPLWSATAHDPNCILFVGRFDLRKGADIMLRAFSILGKSRRELRLVFVGPDIGIPESSGQILNFEAYCRRNVPEDIAQRIAYLGRLPNSDIATLRAQAAVTVIASRWENQGYTALEAMLQGCPVVSSNAGGLPENVVDGRTGRLAESESPGDFARQIGAMLDDPAAAMQLGVNARTYALTEHSPEKVALESVEFYMNLVNRG
jgi:glycosyltransferase involved in cell wall biosynthesis